ncbi:hypothetical protein PR048_024337 [Dryococelus australis]|uniref:RNA-directed DNA polymerase n=1 Tax=Dryococelus australis TaxID=614101 RepID=A0ABQ9GND5_9NEOP|nr:hypothetical protein PR048_024337 [Dryococelus australis]
MDDLESGVLGETSLLEDDGLELERGAARRVWSREEFLHESAGTGGPDVSMRPSRVQKKTETIAEFVVAIKQLATSCKFGTFLNEALGDKLVVDIADERVHQRLLSEDLSFAESYELTIRLEQANFQKNAWEFGHTAVAEMDMGKYPSYSMYNMKINTEASSYQIHVDIESQPVVMEVDTGAAVSVLPEQAQGSSGSIGELEAKASRSYPQRDWYHHRTVPYALKPRGEQELEMLVSQGIIYPVTKSDWATPLVCVMKEDGGLRLCADFKFWTCHQQVAEESQPLLTVNTHKGLFWFKRLQFGLSSAPAIFQSVNEQLLSGLQGVVTYQNDVLVTGPTLELAMERLDVVLARFAQHGVRPSNKWLQAVEEAPEPTNKEELRAYCGLLNYYGKVLPALASRLRAFYELLKKNVTWEWTSDLQRLFQESNVRVFTETIKYFAPVLETPLLPADIGGATHKDSVLARPDQSDDKSLTENLSRKNELTVEEDCILLGSRVVIPEIQQNVILALLHEEHPGFSHMKILARSHIWWPGLDGQIEAVVQSCHACQCVQPSTRKVALQQWPWPARKWQRVHVDFAMTSGRDLLIVMDAHSKWVDVFVMHSTTAIEVMIAKLRTLFSSYRLPEIIFSDNGPQFTSEDFRAFMMRNGIRHMLTPPYHPQSNEMAERVVQDVKKGLLKCVAGHCQGSTTTTTSLQHRVDNYLFSYRNIPSSTTGATPAELFLGRKPRTRLTVLKPSLNFKIQTNQMNKQLESFPTCAPLRQFAKGDNVWVRTVKGEKLNWVPGQVKDRVSVVTYQVYTHDGNSADGGASGVSPVTSRRWAWSNAAALTQLAEGSVEHQQPLGSGEPEVCSPPLGDRLTVKEALTPMGPEGSPTVRGFKGFTNDGGSSRSPFLERATTDEPLGATVADLLSYSPPTRANRVQSPAGSLRIFAHGNRAGRCWSASMLSDLPFPTPFHSGAAPNSPHFTFIGSQNLDVEEVDCEERNVPGRHKERQHSRVRYSKKHWWEDAPKTAGSDADGASSDTGSSVGSSHLAVVPKDVFGSASRLDDDSSRRKSTPVLLDSGGSVITASLKIPAPFSRDDADIAFVEDAAAHRQVTVGKYFHLPRLRGPIVTSNPIHAIFARLVSIKAVQCQDMEIGCAQPARSVYLIFSVCCERHVCTPTSKKGMCGVAGVVRPTTRQRLVSTSGSDSSSALASPGLQEAPRTVSPPNSVSPPPSSWASSPPNSPDGTVTSVDYLPEPRQQRPVVAITAKEITPVILHKVTFASSAGGEQRMQLLSQDLPKSASTSAIQREQPAPASISSIGGAVMRSKTADIERILRIHKPAERVVPVVVERDAPTPAPTPTSADANKYSKRRYTESRHQTRHIPDCEALEAGGGSAAASSQPQVPVYKRRELIASDPKDHETFFVCDEEEKNKCLLVPLIKETERAANYTSVSKSSIERLQRQSRENPCEQQRTRGKRRTTRHDGRGFCPLDHKRDGLDLIDSGSRGVLVSTYLLVLLGCRGYSGFYPDVASLAYAELEAPQVSFVCPEVNVIPA